MVVGTVHHRRTVIRHRLDPHHPHPRHRRPPPLLPERGTMTNRVPGICPGIVPGVVPDPTISAVGIGAAQARRASASRRSDQGLGPIPGPTPGPIQGLAGRPPHGRDPLRARVPFGPGDSPARSGQTWPRSQRPRAPRPRRARAATGPRADQRPAVARKGTLEPYRLHRTRGRATRRNPKGLQSCLAGSVGFSGNEVSGRGTRSGSGPGGARFGWQKERGGVADDGTDSRARWRRARENR